MRVVIRRNWQAMLNVVIEQQKNLGEAHEEAAVITETNISGWTSRKFQQVPVLYLVESWKDQKWFYNPSLSSMLKFGKVPCNCLSVTSYCTRMNMRDI